MRFILVNYSSFCAKNPDECTPFLLFCYRWGWKESGEWKVLHFDVYRRGANVNRIPTDSISNFKWLYFLVRLSMGLVVVYFFAQNFTLYPMGSIVTVEYDFQKSSIFYPLFAFTVLPATSVLAHKKFCRTLAADRPREKDLKYI